MKTDEQKNVLSKPTILCWAAFRAILGFTGPAGWTPLVLLVLSGLLTALSTAENLVRVFDVAFSSQPVRGSLSCMNP